MSSPVGTPQTDHTSPVTPPENRGTYITILKLSGLWNVIHVTPESNLVKEAFPSLEKAKIEGQKMADSYAIPLTMSVQTRPILSLARFAGKWVVLKSESESFKILNSYDSKEKAEKALGSIEEKDSIIDKNQITELPPVMTVIPAFIDNKKIDGFWFAALVDQQGVTKPEYRYPSSFEFASSEAIAFARMKGIGFNAELGKGMYR